MCLLPSLGVDKYFLPFNSLSLFLAHPTSILFLCFSHTISVSNIMAEITITGWDTRDVRFPTSLDKTGSDAMNAAGDYSSAYCILKTDSEFSGHGMVRQLSFAANRFVNIPLIFPPADFYHRSWQRYRMCCNQSCRRSSKGAHSFLSRFELGSNLEISCIRFTTEMDWP